MSPCVVNVVIADDHPVILEGIRRSLVDATIEIINSAHNSTQILQILDQGGVDVLVTDYSMPGGEHGDGQSLLSLLLRRYPNVRIVVMTMMDNPGLLSTMVATSVRCIVSKSDSVSYLIPAIHAAYVNGQYYSPNIHAILHSVNTVLGNTGRQVRLSAREQEVLRLYATGLSINDVAQRLHRSKQTISSQKNSAMRKIGVETDADLFKYMLEVGLGAFPAALRSSS
jgi:two-component system capsular synthesis response regulator RcsB